MIKCLAQGHKCHGRDSNPHSAANSRMWVRITPELESGKLDRSATTLHVVHWHNSYTVAHEHIALISFECKVNTPDQ